MAKSKGRKSRNRRIPKTLKEKVRDFDHCQFLLRTLFHKLPEDPAHLKPLAAELRVLLCLSSGTEGLLWRLCDELGVDDHLTLVAPVDVNREALLNSGLQFWLFPFARPTDLPSQSPPARHSLRTVIKEHEAVFLASLYSPPPLGKAVPIVPPDRLTHEKLIMAVAEQMGFAHEADGLATELVKLRSYAINGIPSYVRRLHQYADLALQIGERVLDRAERSIGYERLARGGCGNVSFTVRFRPNEGIIVPVPLSSMESKISESEISVLVRRQSIVIETRKHGVTGPTMEVGHRANPETRDDVLVAFMYSSQKRQARVIAMPGESQPPTDFDLGWLDAREMIPTNSPDTCEPFLTLRWVNRYERLLATSDCELMMQLSPDAREMTFEKANEDEFPA